MTREEALRETLIEDVWYSNDYKQPELTVGAYKKVINKIYDDFETQLKLQANVAEDYHNDVMNDTFEEKEASVKIIEQMEKENKKALKEIEYWKLSFNKQVKVGRDAN